MILHRMQQLLAQLYDAQVRHDVQDFLLTDRRRAAELAGMDADAMSDEQVLLMEEGDGVRVGVFIDPAVLQRLAHCDPLASLGEANLHDFCTALEGVSHFHYLMWCLTRGRAVSLLELELQAEVDKYASALTLLTRQQRGRFPAALHARLFDRVRFVSGLDAASRGRYEAASHHAAHYCRSLEERYLRRRRSRPEAWLTELRRFFRCGHQRKLQVASG